MRDIPNEVPNAVRRVKSLSHGETREPAKRRLKRSNRVSIRTTMTIAAVGLLPFYHGDLIDFADLVLIDETKMLRVMLHQRTQIPLCAFGE